MQYLFVNNIYTVRMRLNVYLHTRMYYVAEGKLNSVYNANVINIKEPV
jgi:hypothetical protein